MPAPPHLPRDVLLWLQRLDLSTFLRDPARDVADGVLAAEIVARHRPALVHLHAFSPTSNLHARRANWGLLARLMAREGLDLGLTPVGVEAVVRGAPGAGADVLAALYRVLAGAPPLRGGGSGDGGCCVGGDGAGGEVAAEVGVGGHTPPYARHTACTFAAAISSRPAVQTLTDTRARAAAVGSALARWEEERVVARLQQLHQPGSFGCHPSLWVGLGVLGRRQRVMAGVREALRRRAAATCPRVEVGSQGCVRVGQLADGSGCQWRGAD